MAENELKFVVVDGGGEIRLPEQVVCPHCNLAVQLKGGKLESLNCARCNTPLPEVDSCSTSCFSCLKSYTSSTSSCHSQTAEGAQESRNGSLNVAKRLWNFVKRRTLG